MHSLYTVEASNHHFCFHFYPLIEQPSTSVIHNRTAPFTSLYKRIPTLQWHWPVQHSVISFAYQGLQFGVDKGKAGKCCLVHGVNQHLVTVGQPRLLVQELSIKVAAVTGGFLGRKGRGLQSDCDYKFHCGTIDRHSHKKYTWRRKIFGSYHFGLERRHHFSIFQCRPVDSSEKWVCTDVSHHTQPATRVSLKQLKKRRGYILIIYVKHINTKACCMSWTMYVKTAETSL